MAKTSFSRTTTMCTADGSCEFMISFHERDGVAEFTQTIYKKSTGEGEKVEVSVSTQKITFKRGTMETGDAEALVECLAEALQSVFPPDLKKENKWESNLLNEDEEDDDE